MSPWQVSKASGHWQRKQLGATSLLRWYLSPFQQMVGGGGDEIREAPFVNVPNLIARVADTLTHHLD